MPPVLLLQYETNLTFSRTGQIDEKASIMIESFRLTHLYTIPSASFDALQKVRI